MFMDWNVPPKFIGWSQTPNEAVFGERAFMEVIEMKWHHKGGDLVQ